AVAPATGGASMSDTDRLLSAPSEQHLVRALGEVAAAARAEHWPDDPSREPLAGLLTRYHGAAEGVFQCQLPQFWAAMPVAWWADHRGRRHVRLRVGQLVPSGDQADLERMLAMPSQRLPPPLGWVYPGVLVRVERGGARRWLAVCDCGEVGPPED